MCEWAWVWVSMGVSEYECEWACVWVSMGVSEDSGCEWAWVSEHECTHSIAHMWLSQNNIWESVLTFFRGRVLSHCVFCVCSWPTVFWGFSGLYSHLTVVLCDHWCVSLHLAFYTNFVDQTEVTRLEWQPFYPVSHLTNLHK